MNNLEQQLYSNLDLWIKEKMEAKTKKALSQNVPIDEKAILKEVLKEFVQEMANSVTSETESLIKFYKQLYTDNSQLLEKVLEAVAQDSSQLKDVKDQHELFNLKNHVSRYIIEEVYQIGIKHYTQGRLEQASVYFDWLAIFDSDNPQIWFVKGLIQQKSGKPNDALISYYQAVNMNPGFVHAYLQIMNCLIVLKEYDQARDIYESFKSEFDFSKFNKDISFTDNMKFIEYALMQRRGI